METLLETGIRTNPGQTPKPKEESATCIDATKTAISANISDNDAGAKNRPHRHFSARHAF